MNDIKKQADEMLRDIGRMQKDREDLGSEYDEAVISISEQYFPRIAAYNEALEGTHKALIALMKKAKATLFDGTDIVRLENGVLIYNKEKKVTIPKGALEKAEEQGLTDAIKITKSLDRGVVETWPDERLFLIGAMRKWVKKFNYEVKNGR